MRLKLNLSYVVSKVDRETKGSIAETDSGLTKWLIEQAVFARFPVTVNQQSGKREGGVKGSDRKLWGGIQNILTQGVENDEDFVEISVAQLDFVRKSFEAWDVPGAYAGYYATLDEHLDDLAIEAKMQKNGATKATSEKAEV